MQDNQEFICWLSTYGGPDEEACYEDDDSTDAEKDDYIATELPAWLLALDENNNGVTDVFEVNGNEGGIEIKRDLPENVVQFFYT